MVLQFLSELDGLFVERELLIILYAFSGNKEGLDEAFEKDFTTYYRVMELTNLWEKERDKRTESAISRKSKEQMERCISLGVTNIEMYVCQCCTNGFLEGLKLLAPFFSSEIRNSPFLIGMAKKHLHIIKYLHHELGLKIEKEYFFQISIEGYLDCAQWMHPILKIQPNEERYLFNSVLKQLYRVDIISMLKWLYSLGNIVENAVDYWNSFLYNAMLSYKFPEVSIWLFSTFPSLHRFKNDMFLHTSIYRLINPYVPILKHLLEIGVDKNYIKNNLTPSHYMNRGDVRELLESNGILEKN